MVITEKIKTSIIIIIIIIITISNLFHLSLREGEALREREAKIAACFCFGNLDFNTEYLPDVIEFIGQILLTFRR
mgnify:CR=1 FL=1